MGRPGPGADGRASAARPAARPGSRAEGLRWSGSQAGSCGRAGAVCLVLRTLCSRRARGAHAPSPAGGCGRVVLGGREAGPAPLRAVRGYCPFSPRSPRCVRFAPGCGRRVRLPERVRVRRLSPERSRASVSPSAHPSGVSPRLPTRPGAVCRVLSSPGAVGGVSPSPGRLTGFSSRSPVAPPSARFPEGALARCGELVRRRQIRTPRV